MDNSQIDEYLARLPAGDVWSIGRRYRKLLANNAIHTARELRDPDDAWVRHHMSVVGLRTVWELRGIQCLPLELAPPPRQSIICSGWFGQPVTELTDVKEAVATHTLRGAEKLRRQHSIAHCINVFIEANPFKSEPQYANAITFKVDQPTSFTGELVRVAIAGLARIVKTGFNYKRTGIMILGLCSEKHLQGGFWGRAYCDRDKTLMEVWWTKLMLVMARAQLKLQPVA